MTWCPTDSSQDTVSLARRAGFYGAAMLGAPHFSGSSASLVSLGKTAVPVANSATVAASALATAKWPNAVACRASTTLPVRDGERGSSIGTEPAFLMSAEPRPASEATTPTGETDRSAQGRRHLRKSPRVHDAVASTKVMVHSQACDGADLYGRAMSKLRGYRLFREVTNQLASGLQTPP